MSTCKSERIEIPEGDRLAMEASRAESQRAAALGIPKARDFAPVAELEDRLQDLNRRAGILNQEAEAARVHGLQPYLQEQAKRVAAGLAIEAPAARHRPAADIQRDANIVEAAIEEVKKNLQEARHAAAVEAMKTARPMLDRGIKRLKKALEAAIQANQDIEDVRRHFTDQSMPMLECAALAYVVDLPKYWVSDLEKRGY